jgi:hypothetical protein
LVCLNPNGTERSLKRSKGRGYNGQEIRVR